MCTIALTRVALVGLSLMVLGASARAEDVADFYRGKTVTLLVGSGTGDGVDRFARLLARHLGKYIPGNPSVLARNMPGAGGLQSLNHIYVGGPKDGTMLGTVLQALPFEPLYSGKDTRATFDPLRFQWIGSPVRFASIAVAWNASTPVRKAEDLLTHELIVGAPSTASGSATDGYVLRSILGFKFRVVTGYPGGAELDLAMFRGETQGRANISWDALKNRNPDWLTDKKVSLLFQMGLRKHPDIPSDIPLVLDFARNAFQRQVLELKYSSYGLGYPYMAAPDTPFDRVVALRVAMAAALDDPELRAEAAKQRLDIDPVSGEEVTAILKQAYAAPADIVERLAEAARPPK